MKIFKSIKNNKGLIRHNMRSTLGGFTLIETMVAILILSMALTALLGLITSSLYVSRYTKNEITANYLIQEVIDSVKNKRSSSILDTNPDTGGWDNFVNYYKSECSNFGCLFNAENGVAQATSCSDDNCIYLNNYLYYDENASDGSFYNYTSSTKINSNFARKVVVTTNPTNPDEVDVTVTVFWKNGNELQNKSLSVSLLNW